MAFSADTHLHADFLTGAVQLAHDDRATVLASAAGHRRFAHRPLEDGDDVDLGGLTLRALGTPGHTDEHLSYLLLDGDRELGVFTGGSLIVGSAARTDLLGADRAEELARAQYRSLRRLSDLPDATAVWPTHGAGSFCSAPPGQERTSTIGAQKRSNDLLAAPDEDTFVRRLLASLGSYPAYFDRLGELNRTGPPLLPARLDLDRLNVEPVRGLLGEGAYLIDVRPVGEFAAGHIPGAISNALRDGFATWLGWLVPPDVPVIFVLGAGQDPAEVAWQAAKIGYDRLAGLLQGGMDAWAAAGEPLNRIGLIDATEIGDRPVLDVRQAGEYRSGHIPGARNVELGSLPGRSDAAPERAVVMCGHGERAATAASLLTRAGITDLAVLRGGPQEWAQACGLPLDTGQ